MRIWPASGILANWRNAAYGDIQQRTILPSPDIVPVTTQAGTYLKIVRPDADGVADVETAWQQSIVAADPTADPPVLAGVNVSGGPLVWEPGVVDVDWETHTLMASGTPYSATFPAAAENRWLYVQADLTDPDAPVVSAAFMESTAFPAHDLTGGNAIFRFPLSLWACTAAGTGSRIFVYPEMPRIPGYARP
jgi:hypothetical protein